MTESRIETATRECLVAILNLRNGGASGPSVNADATYTAIKRVLDATMVRAAQLGFGSDHVRDIAYALAAFADESALQAGGSLAEFWMPRLLQMHYFKETTAGDGFFERLEALRAAFDGQEVLRVYYLCLLLGFCGRYAVRGGAVQLADLIASTKQTLARSGLRPPDALSPHGERPDEALAKPPPRWSLFWLPAGAVAVAMVLYVILSGLVGREATQLVATIESLLAG